MKDSDEARALPAQGSPPSPASSLPLMQAKEPNHVGQPVPT